MYGERCDVDMFSAYSSLLAIFNLSFSLFMFYGFNVLYMYTVCCLRGVINDNNKSMLHKIKNTQLRRKSKPTDNDYGYR